MRKPPPFATGILLRLGPEDESIVGDLVEEYAAGRSRAWYWRQVLSAAVLHSVQQIRARPVRALIGVAAGWASLLLVFATLGDRTAGMLAKLFWNWDRQMAYTSDIWWPFQICAAFVSYAGFALSAWVVVRLQGRRPGSMLVAYVISVVVALAASAVWIEILTQRIGRVAVPHPLFYIISVTLPFHGRSGLVLAPLIILLFGLTGCRPCKRPSSNV